MRRLARALVMLVLCCCPTAGGGSCCGEVAICGGFIPGCFCTFRQSCGPTEAP